MNPDCSVTVIYIITKMGLHTPAFVNFLIVQPLGTVLHPLSIKYES